MRTLHLGLRVAEPERSIAFYTSLGYQVLGAVPATELGTLTMLKLPDDEFVTLELVHDPTANQTQPCGLSHLVVQVEDPHATVEQLAARGIQADEPESPTAPTTSGRRGPPIRTATASSSSSGQADIPTA
ncbi:MAG TPA: VOC family protein [Nocardioidaceae bacterium]|jgi:lactoylglutathione lyase|nr:VOC family protein [Nocardioidaceae bacterium]